MFDPDTLVVAYDRERGDPRGSRSRAVNHKAKELGDCVDCGISLGLPTGIDIRNGLQYECIGCGACIDGCNQVMDKMGYPKGLIQDGECTQRQLSTSALASTAATPCIDMTTLHVVV